MKESKNELLSVPNALSILRILMIPIYSFFFFHANSRLDYFFCASILAISCVTDFFDGWVARKYKQITRVGKLLDPIADKATQVCLLYSLSIKYPLLLSLLFLLILPHRNTLVFLFFYIFSKKVGYLFYLGLFCVFRHMLKLKNMHLG